MARRDDRSMPEQPASVAPRPGYRTSQTGGRQLRGRPGGQGSKAIAPALLGQVVMGGSLVWRRRRLRGVLPAAVVDPGLRPRFFSVLPTPANFRSR
jgi:hypothetical protein